MKFYTDYPIKELGDEYNKKAPIREVKLLAYDQGLYVDIMVEGVKETIKSGYIYTQPVRSSPDAPHVPKDVLLELPEKKWGE